MTIRLMLAVAIALLFGMSPESQSRSAEFRLVQRARLTPAQFQVLRARPILRRGIRLGGNNDIVAVPGFGLFRNSLGVTIASGSFDTSPEALPWENKVIKFPGGSYVSYSCACVGTVNVDCKFGRTDTGDYDVNTCGGGECCRISCIYVEEDGTPMSCD